MENEESKNRCIRMTNRKWASFKRLLGTKWLDGQIVKAEKREKREKRQPVAKRSDEL